MEHEAISNMMNSAMENCEVTIVPQSYMVKTLEVSEEEMQATRADIKVLMYEFRSEGGNKAEVAEKVIRYSLSDKLARMLIPENELDRQRFFIDDDQVVASIAALMHSELEERPTTALLETKGNMTSFFGTEAGQGLCFYLREDDDEAVLQLFHTLLRIDKALSGELDMHCPQCGKPLGMKPHLCPECAYPEEMRGGNQNQER